MILSFLDCTVLFWQYFSKTSPNCSFYTWICPVASATTNALLVCSVETKSQSRRLSKTLSWTTTTPGCQKTLHAINSPFTYQKASIILAASESVSNFSLTVVTVVKGSRSWYRPAQVELLLFFLLCNVPWTRWVSLPLSYQHCLKRPRRYHKAQSTT